MMLDPADSRLVLLLGAVAVALLAGGLYLLAAS